VVASPFPEEIVSLPAVRQLIDAGIITIACGGGAIPLVRCEDGSLQGVAAVIDKDYASALLAQSIDADLFLISTAVEHVCLNFGEPDEEVIEEMTAAEAAQYIDQGHFAPGSMRPKIKSILWFLEMGGRKRSSPTRRTSGARLTGRRAHGSLRSRSIRSTFMIAVSRWASRLP
jgi:carbamate kinase